MTLKLTRRAWIRTMIYSSFFFTGAVACVSSKKLEIVREDLPIKGLPKEADGLKIGVMSDFHAGAFDNKEIILQSIAAINAEKPDFITILGDYMNAQTTRDSKSLEKNSYIFEALRSLEAPQGIYAVLGNHDHWIDAHFVQDQLSRLPAQILTNQGIILDNGLAMAGIDDLLKGSPDLKKAMANIPPETTTILLSHNPDVNLQLNDEARICLVISGHTHGGQIRIPFAKWAPWVPCSLRYRQSGLIRETIDRSTFVTKGIGTTIIPVRVACPADIAILRLLRV